MLRTSGYVQNCTIGLQWHLMGTYHYSYYNPETSDGKFSQVECLYLLIQYLYIKSKMHTEFFSKLSIFILPNCKNRFFILIFEQIQLLHFIIIIIMKGDNNLHSYLAHSVCQTTREGYYWNGKEIVSHLSFTT